MNRAVHLLAVGLLLAGCATQSATTYSVRDVGRPIETTEGTIVSSRVVEVAGETSGIGPVAGGMVGATAVSGAVGSGAFSGLAAVLGGLLGAGLGWFAEEEIRSGEGIEYLVEMADGRTMTLVQNREDGAEPLADGTPVLVQMGAYYSRVVEHPHAERITAPAEWVDPDTLPPDATPPQITDPAQLPRQ